MNTEPDKPEAGVVDESPDCMDGGKCGIPSFCNGCPHNVPLFTLEQAVERIMACDDLKINRRIWPTTNSEYYEQEIDAAEVMAILNSKESN